MRDSPRQPRWRYPSCGRRCNSSMVSTEFPFHCRVSFVSRIVDARLERFRVCAGDEHRALRKPYLLACVATYPVVLPHDTPLPPGCRISGDAIARADQTIPDRAARNPSGGARAPARLATQHRCPPCAARQALTRSTLTRYPLAAPAPAPRPLGQPSCTHRRSASGLLPNTIAASAANEEYCFTRSRSLGAL